MVLALPQAPAEPVRSVKAWSQPVVPTYRPIRRITNPMFLEKRVYQGSSGRVYPLPFIDRIARSRRTGWKAVHIENEYIRLMILPRSADGSTSGSIKPTATTSSIDRT